MSATIIARNLGSPADYSDHEPQILSNDVCPDRYYINVDTGRWTKTTLTLGARADSYYEYLLKQWLLSGKSDKPEELRHLRAYEEAMAGVRRKLIKKSTGKKTWCFVPNTWGVVSVSI